MKTAIRGYYDGEKVVIENISKAGLCVGDELEIRVIEKNTVDDEIINRRRDLIRSGKYVKATGRSTKEVDDYIKETRSEERF